MLMNRVSPATLCPLQNTSDSIPISNRRTNSTGAAPRILSSNVDYSSRLSQFSQTSSELFPNSQQLPSGCNSGKDMRLNLTQTSQRKHKSDKGHIDYLQRYLSALPPSRSALSQNSHSSCGSIQSGSSRSRHSNDSVNNRLSTSSYEQWKNESVERKGNKAIIDPIIKVTKDCAKELGETLNSFKQSLTNESSSNSQILSIDSFKRENQHMIDYHQICFNKITDNQSEIKQMLSERDSKLSDLETKLDSFVQSTDSRLDRLQDLLVTTLELLKDKDSVATTEVNACVKSDDTETTDTKLQDSNIVPSDTEVQDSRQCGNYISTDTRTDTRSQQDSQTVTAVIPTDAGVHDSRQCVNDYIPTSTRRLQKDSHIVTTVVPANTSETSKLDFGTDTCKRRVQQESTASASIQSTDTVQLQGHCDQIVPADIDNCQYVSTDIPSATPVTCSSRQSAGADYIDLSQVSPSPESILVHVDKRLNTSGHKDTSVQSQQVKDDDGIIVGKCLNTSGHKDTLVQQSQQVNTDVITTPTYGPKLRSRTRNTNSGKKLNKCLSSSSVVTRSQYQQQRQLASRQCKRVRTNSSSDDECNNSTVTTKTTNIKTPVTTRRKPKLASRTTNDENTSSIGDDCVFLNSPVCCTVLRDTTNVVKCRRDEQRKRIQQNELIVKGSQEILKEIQASLLAKK